VTVSGRKTLVPGASSEVVRVDAASVLAYHFEMQKVKYVRDAIAVGPCTVRAGDRCTWVEDRGAVRVFSGRD